MATCRGGQKRDFRFARSVPFQDLKDTKEPDGRIGWRDRKIVSGGKTHLKEGRNRGRRPEGTFPEIPAFLKTRKGQKASLDGWIENSLHEEGPILRRAGMKEEWRRKTRGHFS